MIKNESIIVTFTKNGCEVTEEAMLFDLLAYLSEYKTVEWKYAWEA